MKNRYIVGILATIVGGVVATQARAGVRMATSYEEVSVILPATKGEPVTAHGSLGAARNSADYTQHIGCLTSVSAGNAPRLSCTARDASGEYASCHSSDPSMIAVAQSASGDSFVYFRANYFSGECEFLRVDHHSKYQPKQ